MQNKKRRKNFRRFLFMSQPVVETTLNVDLNRNLVLHDQGPATTGSRQPVGD